jgi:hypothetical protein
MLFLVCASASAQNDIAMSRIIYPESNMRVHLQFAYDFHFTILNFGNNAIPYSSLKFDFLYDKQYWRTEGVSGTGTFNAGDSLEVIIPGLTIASANPTVEICIVSKLGGDIDPTNDTLCVVLEFSLDNYIDFSPVFVDIVDPNIADSNFEVGTKLVEMQGYIRNAGNVTMPKDYSVLIRYTMYSKNRTFAGNVTSTLDPGQILYITMKGGLPTIQSTPGPFNVCMEILNGDDQNPNNNQYCQTFYAWDYTGIQDYNSDQYKSFFYGDKVTIEKPDESGKIQVRIHNSLGQQVYLNNSTRTEGASYINVSHLNPGLYIIDITDEKGRLLHNNKFTID